MNDMKKIAVLQDYLKGLYEAYDAFQTDYKRLHKRSKMHNKESVAEYYLRWRDRMRAEIRRIENLLLKLLPSPCKPCINIKLKVESGELKVKDSEQLIYT
jgi:site-specific DNA-adenine methylase